LASDPGIRRAGNQSWGQFGDTFIENVVGGTSFSGLVNITLNLGVPLVAIGAPVRSYYPRVAERLNASLVIPDHAAVTNAIGAVAGVVMQSVEIIVTQTTLNVFRVHEPDGLNDFDDPEAAIARAQQVSRDLAYDAATRAGAIMPSVETIVRKKIAEQVGGEAFLAEAVICSTATGSPMVAEVVDSRALGEKDDLVGLTT
jgi:N-methylhydantoinase A/oxoprolinase/acetone carboxylase beta subunit